MEKNNTRNNKFGHEFKKSLGQNFIDDKNLLVSIAQDAGVTNEDIVVEVGAGAGTLTNVLASRARGVISFEVDESLTETLKAIEEEHTNLKIIFKDILKVTEEEIEKLIAYNFGDFQEYKVVANIPYYITSPIILKFLGVKKVSSIMVMVQKEVAERITSKPKSKDYGAISVLVQSFSCPKLSRIVKKHNFYPVPKVDSALLKIDKKEIELTDAQKEAYANFIQKAFLARRKTLVNNLMMGYMLPRQKAEELVSGAGFSLSVRPEELSPADFIKLFMNL